MKTLILGFDAFDPVIFENLYEKGRVPTFAKYVDAGGYARFEISNPPQSEVSWTSIATGLNPGEHGLFDFVHRNPQTYQLFVSLLPTKPGLGGVQFTRPYSAKTIFDQAAERGYPATSLWWPATFPARPESPVQTLPGLGTPDVHGRLGVGILFSSDRDLPVQQGKTPMRHLQVQGKNRFSQNFPGPVRQTRQGPKSSSIELAVDVLDENTVALQIGKQKHELRVGVWSPILELPFKMGLFYSAWGLTRLIVTQVKPTLCIYSLPLQIHPLHALWRYGTPGGFVKRAWKAGGQFLTLGWAQDTVGLEDRCISDAQFLSLCDSIFDTRVKILIDQIDYFNEGVLASVFDTLDRVQHMFWRDAPEVIEGWYVKLDKLLEHVEEKLGQDSKTKIIVVSDHGFNMFEYKVHLNHWLFQNGYLNLKENKINSKKEYSLQDVDWMRTKAYAIGLNSLYLNLKGREKHGLVISDEKLILQEEIVKKLLAWKGPNGETVIHEVRSNKDVFQGGAASHGPDLVMGYAKGYRASQQTGLGRWGTVSIEPNQDHWQADHCIAASLVPGVLFSNQGLLNFPRPSYRDFPAISINASPITPEDKGKPLVSGDEDEKLEERLKGLGYF